MPFSLSDEAQAKSGVGVRVSGGLEFRPKLSDKIRLESSVSIQRTEYQGKSFDDTIVSGFAGPRFNINGASLRIGINAFRRWYGVELLNDGVGVNLGYRRRLTSKLEGAISLTRQNISYDKTPSKNGILLSVLGNITYARSAVNNIGFKVGINKSNAKVEHEENVAYRLGVSTSHKLPQALTVKIIGDLTLREFDAIHPTFGVRRSDKLYSINIDLAKRNIFVFGMIPMLRASYSISSSNIPLFDYTRYQAGLAFVKLF